MEIGFSLTIIAVTEAVVLILLCAAAGIMTLFGMKFRKVFLWGLISLAVPPLAILYGHVVEINRVKVRNIEIVSERLPEAFDGYRIAHISDLHLLSFEDRHDRLEEFIDKVKSLSPDLIVFSGDLVTYSPEETEGFEDILTALKAPDGVYSVLGNHDYCIYNDDIPEDMKAAAAAEGARRQEKFGWDVLMNENVEIERISEAGDTSSIVIAGIEPQKSAQLHQKPQMEIGHPLLHAVKSQDRLAHEGKQGGVRFGFPYQFVERFGHEEGDRALAHVERHAPQRLQQPDILHPVHLGTAQRNPLERQREHRLEERRLVAFALAAAGALYQIGLAAGHIGQHVGDQRRVAIPHRVQDNSLCLIRRCSPHSNTKITHLATSAYAPTGPVLPIGHHTITRKSAHRTTKITGNATDRSVFFRKSGHYLYICCINIHQYPP